MLKATLFGALFAIAIGTAQVARPAATLSGRVVDASSSESIVGATVLITALDAQSGTASISPVLTGERGEFSFGKLPPGRYSLSAHKPRYLSLEYGQRPGSGLPGVSITVMSGQQVQDVVIRLPLASVIAGTVVDTRGDPAQGASVQVFRRAWRNGERGAQSMATDLVDDRGQYRIPNLPPGDYIILAQMAAPAPPRPAPTYYPGTPVPTLASPVTLGVSEERTGVNIQMSAVLMSTVEGTIRRADGQPVLNTKVASIETESDLRGLSFRTTYSTANGKFRFENIPPGRYELIASEEPKNSTSGLYATATVVADGNPVKDIELVLHEGQTVSGKLVVEDKNPLTTSPRLTLGPLDREPSISAAFSARPDAEGRFLIKGILPGRYVLTVSDIPPGFILGTVQFDGRDICDLPVDVRERPLQGMEVRVTPVGASLSGTLFDSSGRHNSDLLVVVFPADEKYWLPGSRRIRTARPASDGQYSVRSLPAGSYRVGVVTEAEPGEWFAPPFLKKLIPTSIAFSLSGEESKSLDVRVK